MSKPPGSPRLRSTGRLARSGRLPQFGRHLAQGPDTIVTAVARAERHSVAQPEGTDWVPLRMVGLQEARQRCPMDRLCEFPSEIHRILNTKVESLSTHRRMYVRGVARQKHASVPVRRCLPGHIGKPGDIVGTAKTIVGPVNGNERLADVA